MTNMSKKHKDSFSDQLHRLDTLPHEGSGDLTFIRYEYLLRPMCEPLVVAKAIRVLEAYKAGKAKSYKASVQVLDVIPTQAGAFINKIRKDIKSGKLTKPILIWKGPGGQPYLLDGHHRLAAAVLLGIAELPAIIAS